MDVKEWSKSRVGYGRQLVRSTVDGVRTGESEFRQEGRLSPYLDKAAGRSLGPAALGIAIGACCGCIGSDRRSTAKMLAGSILGGLIGFSGAMLWETRQLTACVGFNVKRSVQLTRDQHWLEEHPIDYA